MDSGVLGAVSRRVRTLVVSGVLFLVLIILALTLPVPYVILSPGVTYNTLTTDNDGNTIIVIDGVKTKNRKGNLNLTTVFVTGSDQSLTVFDVLSAWLQDDRVVVPRSSIYPPGESEDEVKKQDTADFVESQDTAIVAASCALHNPRRFGVTAVSSGGSAYGTLQPGDVITSVLDQPVTDADALTAALASRPAGSYVVADIVRGGQQRGVNLTVPPEAKPALDVLGITVGTVCQAPYRVDLRLANIGGPSAGLMFALGIMDKVGPTDLTRGRFIAGTGTIDADGAVGPIGGIALKMIAARDAGATIFLAPADNCSDVHGNVPDGLQVVKIATLDEAVADLTRQKDVAALPTC